MRGNTAATFWSRVDTSGGPDTCWPWTGRTHRGYGRFDHDGTWDRAHRWAFYLCHGWLPPVVRHRCDNPACCNPLDLVAGTQADNVRDREERGRRDVRGERHPRALFDAEQVALIRELIDSGRWTVSELAREVGHKVSTIHKIARGRNYR